MLEIICLGDKKRVKVTNISDPLLRDMLGGVELNGVQKLALMRLLSMDRLYVHEYGEALVDDVNTLIPDVKLHLDSQDEEHDSRGNKREFVVQEASLATSSSFNENYALNELNKLKRRAVKEGVLKAGFNDIQLTYHDVPRDQGQRTLNVRTFIGDELYPRLVGKYSKKDRLLAMLRTPNPKLQQDYLKFRQRFLEPTKTDELPHRGRKDVPPPVTDKGLQPGMMTPKTARAVGARPLDIPPQFTRKPPGKALFLPPGEDETTLLNQAENERRDKDFPFGAGPSGSMAYDLAVYLHYLLEWKKLPTEEVKKRLLLFGVSRAIAYVKYGHHSFFETLIPLHEYIGDDVFDSPEELYKFIMPLMEMGLREGEKAYAQKTYPTTQFKVHWDSWASDWTDWRSYKFDNYEPWTIARSGSGPVGLHGARIAPGKYIFVVLAADKSFRYLPTHPETGEQYRSHSQLAGGLSVFAAGYFQLGDENRVDWIDNSSGHYKPGSASVQYAKQRLTKLGFDTSATKLESFTPTSADTGWGAWGKQQTMVHLRIAKGWVMPPTGRHRSFPKPPDELLEYMPY